MNSYDVIKKYSCSTIPRNCILQASGSDSSRIVWVRRQGHLPKDSTMNRRAFLQGAAAIGFGAALQPSAFAQSFPSRLVRIVAPTGAGSPPDIMARIVANGLSDGEVWKVIVEDKPGAATAIGAAEVLKQPADGHTLFVAMPASAAAPGLMPNRRLNMEADFTPVIQIGTGYNMLVVNPKVPAHSVSELVGLLKREPGKHTFSSGGFGAPAHLLGELFKLETGVQATHVPYANSMPRAIGDLLNGVNTYQFAAVPPVVEFVRTGQLRGLAVMGPKRLSILPDVPTIIEAGYPSLEAADWSGILVKSGTPPASIARLNQAINEALKSEAVRDALARLGVDVAGGAPERFGALLHAETARWTRVINEAGIKME
jgi:tripartite-type tricarboxylate transporter receptor subunit TctC